MWLFCIFLLSFCWLHVVAVVIFMSLSVFLQCFVSFCGSFVSHSCGFVSLCGNLCLFVIILCLSLMVWSLCGCFSALCHHFVCLLWWVWVFAVVMCSFVSVCSGFTCFLGRCIFLFGGLVSFGGHFVSVFVIVVSLW